MFLENFETLETEKKDLKVMLRDLYSLHLNDKTAHEKNLGKENLI